MDNLGRSGTRAGGATLFQALRRPETSWNDLVGLDPRLGEAGLAADVIDQVTIEAKFAEIMALIQTGVLGAAATLDAKLQQATDAAGTGAKDITGKAIVQIVKATGYTPCLFRAPYGARWFGLRRAQAALGLTGVMWTRRLVRPMQ